MREEKQFETESRQLLDLMINSIYSEKEIFLRELLSNASDAIDKYRYFSLTEKDKYPSCDPKIEIQVDEKKKTISILDNGIGMSKKEMETNLGTIAKSGSKDFVSKYKKAVENGELSVIGQFGVGFYSAFMVGKKVEVISKPYGGSAHRFESDGKATYFIEDAEASFDHGTMVTVYLKKDENENHYEEFCKTYRIEGLVKKYSDYIRYPIHMDVKTSKPDLDENGKPIEGKYHDEVEDKILNSMVPLWKKKAKDVTDEEMNEFYKSKMNDFEDPLIRLNVHVEGLISYDALLFVPARVPYDYYSESYEQGLSLYSHEILIKDHYKELVPEYLKFMRGLVDSDDFPLNISREMLQKTPEMARIASNIETKMLNELKKVKKEDPAKYEKFFSLFGSSIKYGIYSTYGGKKEALQDLLLFHSLKKDKLISLEEYVEAKKEGQKAIHFASGKSLAEIKILPQLEKYKKEDGEDVLLLDKDIDEFCLMMMGEYKEMKFEDVSSEQEEERSEEEKKELDRLSAENKRLLDELKAGLPNLVEDVVLSDKLVESPVCLSASKEGPSMNAERVLKEQPGQEGSTWNSKKILEINPKHPLFEALTKKATDEESIKKYASLLYEEAMLLQGFEVSDKTKFVELLNELMIAGLK